MRSPLHLPQHGPFQAILWWARSPHHVQYSIVTGTHFDGKAELAQHRWQARAVARRDLLECDLPAVRPSIRWGSPACSSVQIPSHLHSIHVTLLPILRRSLPHESSGFYGMPLSVLGSMLPQKTTRQDTCLSWLWYDQGHTRGHGHF